MKDVTFGVKVPEEFRDQINELMKNSGLVGREFMQELVDAYQLDKNKQEIPEMAEEIKELQQLTHRINEMYLYLGTRFQNIVKIKEQEQENSQIEVDQKKQEYETLIERYQDEAKKSKDHQAQLQEQIKKAEKTNQEANDVIIELRSYNENYKELNQQYKEKVQKLSVEVEDLKHLKDDNIKLLKDNEALQEHNDNLASELWFSKREVEKLRETLSSKEEEYKRHLSQIKDQYQLEKQTTQLELQLEKQKAIEALNEKTAIMQKEYNDKLKELLFNIPNTENEKTTEIKGEKK